MEISQLKYFISLAETESITKTANDMFVTPPAVSRAMAKLESELGVQLFDRSNNSICLNSRGRLFRQYVNRASLELFNGVQAMRSSISAEKATIHFATNLLQLPPQLTSSYMEAYPSTTFLATWKSPEDMVSGLEQGSLDFCISGDPLDSPYVEWLGVAQEKILLLVSKAHPLARCSAVRLEDLAEERFLVYTHEESDLERFHQLCRPAHFVPRIAYSASDDADLVHLAAIGLGIYVMPATRYLMNKDMYSRDLHVIRVLNEGFDRTIGIAARYMHSSNEVTALFIDHMLNFYRRMDREYVHVLQENIDVESGTFRGRR